MSKYISEHASALADVSSAGSAVTFSKTVPGTYDPATDTTTGATTSSVSGFAIGKRGDPVLYQKLSLIQSEAPTLFFVPSTIGEAPLLGASVVWGGIAYVVRDVDPLSIDGVPIAHDVVVSK